MIGLGKALLEAYLARPHHIVVGSVRDKSTPEAQALLGLSPAEGSKLLLVKIDNQSVTDAIEAAKELSEKHGLKARIVSAPCFEVFDTQSKEYRLSVLPDGAPIMSVEVMSTLGWERYSHEQFGLNRFGASGAYKDVYKAS